MEKRKKGGGRKKGVPNKLTATLKTMVEQAFHKAGGVTYLVRMSRDEPKAFLSLLGRLLPLQVEGGLTHQFVAQIPPPEGDKDVWLKTYAPKQAQPKQLN